MEEDGKWKVYGMKDLWRFEEGIERRGLAWKKRGIRWCGGFLGLRGELE